MCRDDRIGGDVSMGFGVLSQDLGERPAVSRMGRRGARKKPAGSKSGGKQMPVKGDRTRSLVIRKVKKPQKPVGSDQRSDEARGQGGQR